MNKRTMRIMIPLIPPESRIYLVVGLQETVMAVVTVAPIKIVLQTMTETQINGKRRKRK